MNGSVFCPHNTLRKLIFRQSNVGIAVDGLNLWGTFLLAGR